MAGASHQQDRPDRGSRRSVIAVRHAAEILRCISKSPDPLGINEIARRVGLDKSSVSRLIATLEELRLVERATTTSRLRLGVGLMALAAPLLADFGLPTLFRPRLEILARQSGETANLSVWDGLESVSIIQALGTSAITHYAVPGQRNPAHCTASGKVLLAFAPRTEVEAILARPLEPYTSRTITDPDALRAELARIRAAGWALNCGEFASDVGAVAAIVRDTAGRFTGALTITVPMYRFDEPRQLEILGLVRDAAAELSEQLDHLRP